MSQATLTRTPKASGTGRLTGKVALVVGGGWGGPDDYAIGIGGAICQLFTREGAKVAVNDIEDENAERTLKPILREGGEAFKLVADTAKEADCKRMVDEVMKRYGQLDILINNPGIGTAKGYEPGSEEAFDRIWAVNLKGEILMAKHAVPHMRPGSVIINIGSVFGAVDPIPGAYAMSKGAVSLVVTPTLAAQYAPQGIRVNCVTAGYVWNAVTQLVQDRQAPGSSMADYRSGRSKVLNALRIEGDGWDVAKAVTFLASDDARWITGQDLIVDGGYSVLNVWDHSPYGKNLAATAPRPGE